MTTLISAECNVPSKYLTVKGSQMHYLEQGEGDPILFLHGIPTYSYLWRNVIPLLADTGRCIAPDLIGMGKSEKPDIPYRVFDHIAYLDEFIAELDLSNITLVLHGWGSVIGLDFARRHADRIKGIVLYESHLRPTTDWHMLSLPVQQFAALLNRPGSSYRAIVKENYLVDKLLPSGVIRELSQAEMTAYREPFSTLESRQPLWQYAQDLPLGDGPEDVVATIKAYSTWLQETQIPKLLFFAVPGFITTMETVSWARDHFPNLTLAALEDVLHFAQETEPDVFAEELKRWYLKSCVTTRS